MANEFSSGFGAGAAVGFGIVDRQARNRAEQLAEDTRAAQEDARAYQALFRDIDPDMPLEAAVEQNPDLAQGIIAIQNKNASRTGKRGGGLFSKITGLFGNKDGTMSATADSYNEKTGARVSQGAITDDGTSTDESSVARIRTPRDILDPAMRNLRELERQSPEFSEYRTSRYAQRKTGEDLRTLNEPDEAPAPQQTAPVEEMVAPTPAAAPQGLEAAQAYPTAPSPTFEATALGTAFPEPGTQPQVPSAQGQAPVTQEAAPADAQGADAEMQALAEGMQEAQAQGATRENIAQVMAEGMGMQPAGLENSPEFNQVADAVFGQGGQPQEPAGLAAPTRAEQIAAQPGMQQESATLPQEMREARDGGKQTARLTATRDKLTAELNEELKSPRRDKKGLLDAPGGLSKKSQKLVERIQAVDAKIASRVGKKSKDEVAEEAPADMPTPAAEEKITSAPEEEVEIALATVRMIKPGKKLSDKKLNALINLHRRNPEGYTIADITRAIETGRISKSDIKTAVTAGGDILQTDAGGVVSGGTQKLQKKVADDYALDVSKYQLALQKAANTVGKDEVAGITAMVDMVMPLNKYKDNGEQRLELYTRIGATAEQWGINIASQEGSTAMGQMHAQMQAYKRRNDGWGPFGGDDRNFKSYSPFILAAKMQTTPEQVIRSMIDPINEASGTRLNGGQEMAAIIEMDRLMTKEGLSQEEAQANVIARIQNLNAQ